MGILISGNPFAYHKLINILPFVPVLGVFAPVFQQVHFSFGDVRSFVRDFQKCAVVGQCVDRKTSIGEIFCAFSQFISEDSYGAQYICAFQLSCFGSFDDAAACGHHVFDYDLSLAFNHFFLDSLS